MAAPAARAPIISDLSAVSSAAAGKRANRAVSPCVTALYLQLRFPSDVRGPVLFWSFCLLAAFYLSHVRVLGPVFALLPPILTMPWWT